MSHQYRVRNYDQIHFVTFTIVDWVDIFSKSVYKRIIDRKLGLLDVKLINEGFNELIRFIKW